MQNVSELIKIYRKKYNYTQQQLGELCGKKGKSAQIYISNLENGKRKRYHRQELKLLMTILEIPNIELENALEYTATKKHFSQKTARNLRDTLLKQTNIISLMQLMDIERSACETWVVAAEGIHQKFPSPLEFDLTSSTVKDTVVTNLLRGVPYRYLLVRNRQNIFQYKKLLAQYQTEVGFPLQDLIKATFVDEEVMGLLLCRL